MITIIDYGMGNLRSVQKALEHVGAKAKITQNHKDIDKAVKIVLPGVGAMQPAYDKLKSLYLIEPIKNFISKNKPFLGICLGLQLLFEESDEGQNTKGLGILKGNVNKFTKLKIPQMGWNQIIIKNRDCKIFKGIDDLANVYFCHSYFANPKDKNDIASTTSYGREFASSVNKENIFGVQFHPEKSQKIGLKILENFTKI
ncbi:MAG: imidazole glycerol phosphate synthase subunit HisH [Candidatus Omnitrophica bacterium]|nr:imidazole glycerol phosphate synthase subunit HisH [Candidatus Omnitrophota bacterium]